MLARTTEAAGRQVPPIHPHDLVGATQDHEAVHLHVEDFDDDLRGPEPALWQRLPAWIDIPLRPMMTEHPAASLAAVGSLFIFVVALVML